MYGDEVTKGPKLPLFVILCVLCGSTAPSKGQTGLATGPLRVLPSNPRYFTDGSGRAIYLAGTHNWHSLQDNGHRLYNGEDPATGSASGCAAAWMVQHGVAQADERVMIEQGLEMKRPSRIFVRASRTDDRVVNVRVGGNVVEVLRGELFF